MANTSKHQHPTTTTLLDYLDNCCSTDDSNHIQHCVVCLNEVVQISESRSQLQRLPQVQAPAHLWANIQQEIKPASKIKNNNHWHYQWFATAATIIIALTVFLLNPLQDPESPGNSVSNSEYINLLQQSQQLESVLAYLDRQPTIVNLSTVGRISQYRDSIATVDLALNETSQGNMNHEFRNTLMKERIHLLRQLVKQKSRPLLATYKTF